MSETRALALEIGCEEIPARFLTAAERDLGEQLGAALNAARLLPPDAGKVKTASTPRRLIAYVPALLNRQPSRTNTEVGPPAKAAFDKSGKPTRAAESFATKHGAEVSALRRLTTSKGEYVALDVIEAGNPALQVLVEIIPAAVGALSFPKSMYWTAKAGPRFVRPIRWLLALLGDEHAIETIPFEFAGVRSGSVTYGHRLDGSGPLGVTDLNLDLFLENHLVIVSSTERRDRVRDGVKVLLEDSKLRSPGDAFLEDWVVNSTEWPVPILGDFDERYLALPREVLVTVMRDHQKYFAVEDSQGNLRPHFITVLNVPGDPKGLIRQEHERVLRARFADAEFFWNADQKIALAERIPLLERVTYQAKLGTYGDKVRRMKAIAGAVCDELSRSGRATAGETKAALRAIELSKCDLTTQMVQEFTELQGVIGGLYARSQGEPAEVSIAIYDHYRPAGIEDSCPRSIEGAVVSFADKLDAVVAGFNGGLEPSGSSDPFALRRAGNGIVKLAIEMLPRLDIMAILGRAALPSAGRSNGSTALADDLRQKLAQFLSERAEFYLRESARIRYDTARAVLGAVNAVERFVPSEILRRAQALERVRDTDDFRALAAAAKRTRNITRNINKAAEASEAVADRPDPRLFAEPAETELYSAYAEANREIARLSEGGEYDGCFHVMASLRPHVDQFFDRVLVMAEDDALRRNRLALLLRLNEDVFTSVADLAEIAGEARAGA